jgi:hypothetical protein
MAESLPPIKHPFQTVYKLFKRAGICPHNGGLSFDTGFSVEQHLFHVKRHISIKKTKRWTKESIKKFFDLSFFT